MRDDSGARTQVTPESRHQLLIQTGQQKQRHHRGRPDIGLEQILIEKHDTIRDARFHGVVLRLRDQPPDRSGDRRQGMQNDSSEPKGQELNYSARVSLDRTEMQIDDRMVNLSPGMAVTVEIKTGSRTILSYLLSPLLRYRQEILRER
jgi:hemolysin D